MGFTFNPYATILHIHISKSSSVLVRHAQPVDHCRNNRKNSSLLAVPREEKLNTLEMAFVSKRAPQYPVPTPTSPLSHPHHLLKQKQDENDQEDEEETIMRAVQIRKRVTMEMFKQAMARGKFGITYSTNLVSMLSEFTNFVMIEAAALKMSPEFQNSTFNLRARTVIDNSNIVPLIRWLKDNNLSYPKIAKLICMSKGNLESIRRLVEWLKKIHVRGEFLGVALLESGCNLLESKIEEMDDVVGYLEIHGVGKGCVGYVVSRCPRLLSYRIDEVKDRVAFYLNMGIEMNDFGTMVLDYPKLLAHFTLEEMRQKVDYLKEFRLGTEEVGRLLAHTPELMGCSIEAKWKPFVKYLYHLGISRDGMKKIITSKPALLCFDLENIIAPKVRFFRSIGVHDDAIGNMLVKFPALLTYSLRKKLRPTVMFLRTRAGVSEKEMGKVIAMGPQLMGCSIEKRLEVNANYFLSLGITLPQLGEMIADFPMLLRYRPELLRSKYHYLRRTMVRTLQDVIEFPRCFSYSLEGRIIPRNRIMVEKRVNFTVRHMLACKDEEFNANVRDQVERRRKFEFGLEVE